MIELGVIFGLYVVCSLFAIMWITYSAQKERMELENKLMALTNPQALVLHKAQEKPIEADIHYVDDEPRDPDYGT